MVIQLKRTKALGTEDLGSNLSVDASWLWQRKVSLACASIANYNGGQLWCHITWEMQAVNFHEALTKLNWHVGCPPQQQWPLFPKWHLSLPAFLHPCPSPHPENLPHIQRSQMPLLLICLLNFLFLSVYLYLTWWRCGRSPHSQLATQPSPQWSNQRPYFTGMR